MTDHASHQPRNEQESYQPLWDDSLPVPSYMNISLGNSAGTSRKLPRSGTTPCTSDDPGEP